ncbi:MAG: ankyrin repeat domain-containing protein [Actinobacteria bacterium]|nr:ankyrin repeat domain-containing protein [Actinomycetota bacterium]
MSEELLAAIKDGDDARVRELLAWDPSLADARDASGVSALMLSQYHGAHDATKAIRAARAELDTFEAATFGDVDRLHELLHQDPTVLDARSPDDATALHFAAFFARPETARLLVDHGADVHAVSPTFGNVTPLHSAAAGGSAEIVHLLLDAGADPNARQNGGFTALHSAGQNGDAAMARDLLDHGAEIDSATEDGRSALAIAEEQGHDEVAALLTERS